MTDVAAEAAPTAAHRLSAAILGAVDGTTLIAGVVAAGLAVHTPHLLLARTAFGAVAAETVAMVGAEWLAQGRTDWAAVGTMGVGTVAGAAVPAVPLLLVGGYPAWWAVLALCAVVAVVVGLVRARLRTDLSLAVAVVHTLAVVGLGIVAGVAIGGG